MHPSKSSVCMIIKNEEAHIKEWVCYHKALGFDTIIILDNNSTDNTRPEIEKLGRFMDVRYHLWEKEDFFYQIDAYNFCISTYREEFRWMAFIDSDEFIVPKNDENINDFLEKYDAYDALVLNWAMFGSSGHINAPEGLMMESFTRRSDENFYNTRHVKTILNPKKTKHCINPHVFEIDGRSINVLHREPTWEKPGIVNHGPIYDECQINHYYTRSQSEWIRKIKRGYPDMDTSAFDNDKIMEGFRYADLNDVVDVSALRFLKRTKEIISAVDLLSSLS
ncbi:glycosyltransferase family 92 protein [Komagataeibacter sp. NFXK3]